MVLAATYVEAPAVEAAPFGLLDVAKVIDDTSGHFGMGITIESDWCGPAWPTLGMCIGASALGTVSVAITSPRIATITGTGEPAGNGYTVDWGSGGNDTGGALDGQTFTYPTAGTYQVQVRNPSAGYYATVWVTVPATGTAGPFTANAQYTKTDSDGIPITTADPFAVYHMTTCRTIGSWDRASEQARRALESGAGRAVEQVMEGKFAAAAANVTPVVGTGLDIVDGLAVLEQEAVNRGGIKPTIHMPRGLATRLGSRGSIVRVGSTLETILGSPVAAGGGYVGNQGAGGAATPAGNVWLFATGPVVLVQGSIVESGPQPIKADVGSGGVTGMTNDFRALAERPYAGAWLCFAIGVLVKQQACCP